MNWRYYFAIHGLVTLQVLLDKVTKAVELEQTFRKHSNIINLFGVRVIKHGLASKLVELANFPKLKFNPLLELN